MAAERRGDQRQERIGEVESHFEGLRLGVGRRHRLKELGGRMEHDYGDGRVYRNVAELRDGRRSVSPTTGASRSSRPPGGRSSRPRSRCRRTVRGRPPRGCRATTMPLEGGCLARLVREHSPYVAATAERIGLEPLLPARGGGRADPAALAGSPGGSPAIRASSVPPATRCCSRSPTRPSARGVTQHSDFKADPWGRLPRHPRLHEPVVYGGPELAWRMGRRVRETHGGSREWARRRYLPRARARPVGLGTRHPGRVDHPP